MKKIVFLLFAALMFSAYQPSKTAPLARGAPESVTPYQALIWETKRREQGAEFHDKVYWDKGGAGSWAIGYGIRITPAEARKWKAKGRITKEEANQLTIQYYEEALVWVDRQIPGLAKGQRLAVASLVYTMGPKSLMRTKLWRLLKKREVGAHVERVWHKTACGFHDKGKYHYRSNIARTRQLESAMWHSHINPEAARKMQKMGREAQQILINRK